MGRPVLLFFLPLLAGLAISGCTQDGGSDDLGLSCPRWVTPTVTVEGESRDQSLLVVTHAFQYNRTTARLGPHSDGGPLRGQESEYDPYRHGVGAARLEHEASGSRLLPLDVIRFEIDASSRGHGVVDGTVQAYVTAADGRALLLYPHGPSQGEPMEYLEIGPETGDLTLFIPLAPSDGEAAPQPIRVDWIFVPDADGDPDTDSAAVVTATYVPMYRSWEGLCVDGHEA